MNKSMRGIAVIGVLGASIFMGAALVQADQNSGNHPRDHHRNHGTERARADERGDRMDTRVDARDARRDARDAQRDQLRAPSAAEERREQADANRELAEASRETTDEQSEASHPGEQGDVSGVAD
jgi:hypothetical protein